MTPFYNRARTDDGVVHSGIRIVNGLIAMCQAKVLVGDPSVVEGRLLPDYQIGEDTEEPTTCVICLGRE